MATSDYQEFVQIGVSSVLFVIQLSASSIKNGKLLPTMWLFGNTAVIKERIVNVQYKALLSFAGRVFHFNLKLIYEEWL